jgi:PST family polysaccharide transporter
VSVAKKTASGAAWTIATNLGSRGVSLAGTLLLARYIHPDAYGEVMAASVVATTALAFSNLGLNQYLVARPKSGADTGWHVTVYTGVLCAIGLAIGLILQKPLGAYFKVSDIGRYLPALAAVAMCDRFSSVAERLLQRDLRWRLVGINNAVGEMLYAAVSVGCVIGGLGGMAIVWGNIARSVQRAVVIFIAADPRLWILPRKLSWATTRALFGFGLPLSPGSIAGFASRRWDNMLVSRYFGAGSMGAYNIAYNLADLPASQVGEQIGDVLLPSFAHLRDDERRRGFVRAVQLLALVVFPLAVGLGAVSETLVAVFFTKQWTGIASMLTVLSALSLLRPIGYAVAAYLQAAGKPLLLSMLEVGKLAALLALIIALGRLGPLWVCGGVGIAFALHAIAGLALVSADKVPFWSTLLGLSRPLLACAPMVASVLGMRWAWQHAALSPIAGLLGEVTIGALVFVASAFIFARPIADDFVGLALDVMRKRRKTETPPEMPVHTETQMTSEAGK